MAPRSSRRSRSSPLPTAAAEAARINVDLVTNYNPKDRDISKLFNPDIIRMGTVWLNSFALNGGTGPKQLYYYQQAADLHTVPGDRREGQPDRLRRPGPRRLRQRHRLHRRRGPRRLAQYVQRRSDVPLWAGDRRRHRPVRRPGRHGHLPPPPDRPGLATDPRPHRVAGHIPAVARRHLAAVHQAGRAVDARPRQPAVRLQLPIRHAGPRHRRRQP